MNLRIRIDDTASMLLRGMIKKLTGGEMQRLHEAAGEEVQRVTVRHIFDKGDSEYFREAAKKVAGASALSAGVDGATLTINHPGFTRAFRDVRIVPREAKSLAFPIHPIARGQRAAALWDRLGLFIPKGKNVIAATIGGVITPLYVLCRSVTQKQDRSLLPSDEDFRNAALLGATQYLRGGK